MKLTDRAQPNDRFSVAVCNSQAQEDIFTNCDSSASTTLILRNKWVIFSSIVHVTWVETMDTHDVEFSRDFSWLF